MKVATVKSSPNIALIKYWGNRNNALRLPAADSLSMTLDMPQLLLQVNENDTWDIRSMDHEGLMRDLTEKDQERFTTHVQLCRDYLASLGVENALPKTLRIMIHSNIPSGIGLASSAAVFSAAAFGYADLVKDDIKLTEEQISVMARLGSGSAARGIHGGFVALTNQGDGYEGAVAEQIAKPEHWALHDIVVAPNIEHKKVGSTEGHALAHTSPHWEERLKEMPRRQHECIDAIVRKDFEKLQRVTEEDCLDMHKVMETSTPPLVYLNDETHRIIAEIIELRSSQHLPVLYTMDAGPTVHLICTEEAREVVQTYAHAQEDCKIFETKVGGGVEHD